MTNKQLLKRLHYIQNKFLDIKGYSFHLHLNNKFEWQPTLDIFIHGYDCEVLYHNNFNIEYKNINTELQELKDFTDDLFNNQKTRN